MAQPDEQRDRLSKAMGAAFLAHQVNELERSVDSIAFSRDSRHYNTSNQDRSKAGTSASGTRGGRGKRETRIVDVSVLVHALPVLKRWIREDTYLLIVPLEVISTLDILKRAPNPLHDLAKVATAFLDTQLSIARQIASEPLSASLKASAFEDPRIRLRAQAAGEELSWSKVEEVFKVPEGFVMNLPATEPIVLEEGEDPPAPPLPTVADIPRAIRSTIQCALYFQSLSPPLTSTSRQLPTPLTPTLSPKKIAPSATTKSKSKPTPTPLLLHPTSPDFVPSWPLHIPAAQQPQRTFSTQPSAQPAIDFNSLASGNTIHYFLSTFFPSSSVDTPASPLLSAVSGPLVPLQSITSIEILAAKEWAKQAALAAAAAASSASSHSSSNRGGNTNSRGASSSSSSRGGGRGERTRGGRGKRGEERGRGTGLGRVLFEP